MTGVHTHICVKHTVYDAFVRGYKIIIAYFHVYHTKFPKTAPPTGLITSATIYVATVASVG